MTSRISTRVLVLSDTHGEPLAHGPVAEKVDVVFHCGDLTEESKLHEFEASLHLLQQFDAPLKLVIAGNHDWTLDDAVFQKKMDEMNSPADLELVAKEYGRIGDAKKLLTSDEALRAGIVFLDEGTHSFKLKNGALLTVYASPYTASVNEWAFNYHPQAEHTWSIGDTVDVAITHSPPKGVLDMASRQRAGSSGLFAAIARAKPLMHCFGHIHESWGAKKVAWRELTEEPSHFTDIDNDESILLESLTTLRPQTFDGAEEIDAKALKRVAYQRRRCCFADGVVVPGQETLFVNAAIESVSEEDEQQLPWVAELHLPCA